METTLIILKPDAVQRGLMGRILSRFEEKGLQMAGAKFMTISENLLPSTTPTTRASPFMRGLSRS